MEDQVEFTIVDLLESKRLKVALPMNVPIGRLLPELVVKMGVPADAPCFIGWRNRVLQSADTLSEAEVQAHSPLYLLFSHTDYALLVVDQVWIAELPTNVPVNQFWPVLAERMSLSGDVLYPIQYLPSGRFLRSDDTLNEVGAKDGDALQVLRNATDAGCIASTSNELIAIYCKLIIEDPSSYKKSIVELPVDEPVSRLLPALATKIQMPGNIPDVTQHVRSGRLLRGDQILSDVEFKEGDTLRLLSDITDVGIVPSAQEDLITLYSKVIVTDTSQRKRVIVELPTDDPVSRLLPAVATKMGLPGDVQYAVEHPRSRRLVRGNDTLSGAGIQEGDTLRLTPDTVKVTVVDQEGVETITAELSANAPVSYLLTALVTKMGLPGDVQYAVQHPRSGRLILGDDTLRDAGVQEGDTLRLIPDPTVSLSSKIRVVVTDQAMHSTVTAELPANVTMSRLLPALITKMQLRTNLGYGIQHKQSGKQLQSSDTLTSAGVKDDHTLILLPNVTAGGPGGGFITLFGISFTPSPAQRYRCDVGPHFVLPEAVAQRDAAGCPLCPEHHTVMTLELSTSEEA